jgi:hypothetical protein
MPNILSGLNEDQERRKRFSDSARHNVMSAALLNAARTTMPPGSCAPLRLVPGQPFHDLRILTGLPSNSTLSFSLRRFIIVMLS